MTALPMARPLVSIVRRTDPTPATCELACGHVFVHPLYSGCSSTRHRCRDCPSTRPDDRIVGGQITDPSRLVVVADEPGQIIRLVPRS